MDAAREWTDGELERLERRMAREYAQAAREMRGRQEQALRDYARELEQRERALDDAPDATAAHEAWLRGQAAKLTRLGAMSDQLAAAASEANRRASAMVNDSLPGIFAENANRAAFEVDGLVGRDTAFSLVDESTVRHLMGLGDRDVINREVVYEIEPGMEPVQSIRKAEFEEARDIRWNRQKFASAITQGILQGESIPDIVKRTDEIFNSNRKAAVRAARTACTSAENAGRVGSYRRADRLGIPLVQEWMATLDGRTRGSHRALDGERVEVGGEFSNGCRYPGDPHGPASEVWNCRCTIRARVRGFEDERQEGRWSRLPEGVTYEEWKAGKDLRPRPAPEPARGTAPRQTPARTKYTMAELRGMGRPELERTARAVAAEHAADMGIAEAEALRRFDMLVDGNSDAQLRKYINQHGRNASRVSFDMGDRAPGLFSGSGTGKLPDGAEPEIQAFVESFISKRPHLGGVIDDPQYGLHGVRVLTADEFAKEVPWLDADEVKRARGFFESSREGTGYNAGIVLNADALSAEGREQAVRTFKHEFGHYIGWLLDRKGLLNDEDIIDFALDEYRARHPDFSSLGDDAIIARNLGSHAFDNFVSGNNREPFADAFQQWQSEGPSEFAIIVGDMIDEGLEAP